MIQGIFFNQNRESNAYGYAHSKPIVFNWAYTILFLSILFLTQTVSAQSELDLVKRAVGGGTNGRMSGDGTGRAVAVSGNIMVAGAYGQDYDSLGNNYVSDAGAVYIYYKDQGGANNWGLVKKLAGGGTNGRISSDNFGWSVAVSGEIIVVGAIYQDYDASGANLMSGAGAAYVYYKDQGGTDNWGLVKKLVGSGTNGREAGNSFGFSVSISGEVIVIGAPNQRWDSVGANSVGASGAAFIFHRDQGGSDNWGLVKKVTGEGTNGRVFGDYFGRCVSVNGETLVVGAYLQDYDATGGNNLSNAGAAYVFYRNQGGTNNWGHVKKLVASGSGGRVAEDRFGNAVSVSGDIIVVGAYYHDLDTSGANSLANAGAAYIFHKDQGGADNWGFVKKLTGEGTNGRNASDEFGVSVAVSGDLILVGASSQDYDDNGANYLSNAGAAYVYFRNKGGTDNWGLHKKLAGSGTNGRLASNIFGYHVSLDASNVVVGVSNQSYDSNGGSLVSNAGASYVYKVNLFYASGTWIPQTPDTTTGEMDLVIPGSSSVTLPDGATVHNLIVNETANVTLNGGESFTVKGDLVNSGNFAGSGSLILDANTDHAIQGTGTVANITLGDASRVSITDSLKISGVLSLSTGTLSVNGRLVLTATDSMNYGQISPSGAGGISGNIVVQKALANTDEGWRQIGIPVATNIGNLLGVGLLGSSHPTANERNIYYWDAGRSSGNTAVGWVAANTATNDQSKAYVLFGSNNNAGLHDLSQEWYVSGTYETGTRQYALFASDDPNGGGSSDKTGWNLIPNPYASNLDVNLLFNATGFPSYKAIHVWDISGGTNQFVGICSTGVSMIGYNNGASISSKSVLSPYQAFWVKASTDDTLVLTNALRTTDMTGVGTYMKKNYPILRLNVLDAQNGWDQVVVYLHPEGKLNFSEATDAYKMFSMDAKVPSLYLYKESEGPLSIKGLPENLDSGELALSVKNPRGEVIRFVPNLSELPEEWEVFLKDIRDGSFRAVHAGDTLSYTIGAQAEGVLFLVLKKKAGTVNGIKEQTKTAELQVGSNGEKVWIQGHNLDWESSAYTLYDPEGNAVGTGILQLEAGKGNIGLLGLSRGVYFLKLEKASRSYSVIRD